MRGPSSARSSTTCTRLLGPTRCLRTRELRPPGHRFLQLCCSGQPARRGQQGHRCALTYPRQRYPIRFQARDFTFKVVEIHKEELASNKKTNWHQHDLLQCEHALPGTARADFAGPGMGSG